MGTMPMGNWAERLKENPPVHLLFGGLDCWTWGVMGEGQGGGDGQVDVVKAKSMW